MSTTNKIDPTKLDAKKRRLQVVREFRRAAVKNRGSLLGEAYAAIAHKLEAIRTDPALSSAQKEKRFSRLIQEMTKV